MCSPHSIAQEANKEDWFQIEYILFEHLYSSKNVLRFEDVRYTPPSKHIEAQYLYPFGKPISPNQYAPIDEEKATLSDALRRLKQSRDLRVHDHGFWQQSIAKESSAFPLKIEAGKAYKDRFELEGFLTVRRSRYMHADINIYHSKFIELPYSDLKDWFFEGELEKWPISWLALPLAYVHPSLEAVGSSYVNTNTVRLNQSRRIKDDEIHYIDHPAIGLVVTIKKIDDPNALDTEYLPAEQ